MGITIKVNAFQLLQWKHAIKLEEKGIKIAGRSVRAHAGKRFGMGSRPPFALIQRNIQSALDALESAGVASQQVVEIQLVEEEA